MDFTRAEYVDSFMDVRLVEFVLSLPPLPWCFRKYVIRQARQGVLPVEVLAPPESTPSADPYAK